MKKENKTAKPKEKISLGAYHKSRFRAWIAVLAAEVFIAATEYAKADDKTWTIIVTLVLLFAAVVFIVIWLANVLGKDIDKEDELAKENMTKAHEAISQVMLTVFAVIVLITIIWKGSFTITIDHSSLNTIWMLVYSMYLSLESGLFLHFEGKYIEAEDE